MDPLAIPAEALLAVSGVLRKSPLTEKDAERARQLPGTWVDMARAFLREEEFRQFKAAPEVGDYEETFDRLSQGLDPSETENLVAEMVNVELGHAYAAQLGRARQYLVQHWPINSISTLAGPKLLPPSTMQQGQAWSLFAVLNGPTRILEEMLMGTLLDDQVQAFKAIYPGLYDRLDQLVEAEVMERKAKAKDYTVPWDRERVLRTLLGLPQDVPISDGNKQTPTPKADPGTAIDIDFSKERGRSVDAAS